ncbi:MAG: GntR family transcriptional regulator [Lachnospiraceae bacterium]|jgi:DNA-binding GntR family transcriptional regulator|nr:GntR family transcriptional regulator [Lachnospiraceae bacterium]MDD5860905.1 GntR family transcriptional regulator [Eubacteriales bacterium]MCH4064053.1 GntR family transcriptional regulator [Lachnospiraceae bacterium]MCH4103222.1 GntR family transcriptional regulator [Lachnospiraceae bacterium]MCI1455211.1 GntR family transcriptional regulator [Lachnospiraceae bacterium]
MTQENAMTNPEDYMPLREVVFMTLRRQILRGELKPGERLMEISLANKLGVSRTPIREAIRMLEHEGLVVMVPRRGAHVAEITRQELNDVLEIRKTLEVLAIQRACANMTDRDIRQLREAEEAFAILVERKDADITALGEADEHFHDIIYQGTNNRRLIQILNNLREQMYRFRVEYLKDIDIRQMLVREHDAIVKALEIRDTEEAVRLVTMHIDNQYRAINKALDERDQEENAKSVK